MFSLFSVHAQNGEFVLENLSVLGAGAAVTGGSPPEGTLLITTDYREGAAGEGAGGSGLLDGQMVIDEHMVGTDKMIDVHTGEGHIIENPVPELVLNGEGEPTDSLQILDASTGESVMIVADSSILNFVREQQLTLDSGQGKSTLEKVQELIASAGHEHIVASALPAAASVETTGAESSECPLDVQTTEIHSNLPRAATDGT